MAGADTLTELLAAAARAPEAPAIHYGDATISYGELEASARRVARGLADLGVGEGERVALWLPNAPAWLELNFACARLGAIAVAVNTRFRSAEVADIVGRSGAKVLAMWPGFKGIDFPAILEAVDPAALETLDSVIVYDEGEAAASFDLSRRRVVGYRELAARPPLAEDGARPDLGCNIFTTSGTTKAPKFVLHTQASLARHAGDVVPAFGYGAADAHLLQALPFCGVFGICQTLAAIAAGRPMTLEAAFDGEAAAALVEARRITHMNGSDEMYRRMFDAAGGTRDLSSLRKCGFGAFAYEPLRLVEEADARGVPLVGLYGMSEVQALYAVRAEDAPPAERARAGGGLVSPAARVRVRDPETGALLSPGESGELELSGPSLMAGYFGDPQATAETFTEDGYVRSGDLGRSEADGGFVFLARMGDVLRLGGFLVAPAEISAHIEAHIAVAQCQVVGIDGPRGAEAVAFVVPAEAGGIPEEALRAHCAQGLAGFKVPRRFFAVDEFPTTMSPNGVKVQLAKLREMAKARMAEGREAGSGG